jgi:hypothetical protein
MHMSHDMAGMATPEQMAQLAASEGVAFDRLFLELMIAHHEGRDHHGRGPARAAGLGLRPGALRVHQRRRQRPDRRDRAHERDARRFPTTRGPAWRRASSTPPRPSANLEHSWPSCRKPEGFFDADNPGDLPLERLDELAMLPEDYEPETGLSDDWAEERRHEGADDERPPARCSASRTRTWPSPTTSCRRQLPRLQRLSLQDDGVPSLISSVVCPGGQGDVSIVGDPAGHVRRRDPRRASTAACRA